MTILQMDPPFWPVQRIALDLAFIVGMCQTTENLRGTASRGRSSTEDEYLRSPFSIGAITLGI